MSQARPLIDMSAIQTAVACVIGGTRIDDLPEPLREPLRVWFQARAVCGTRMDCDFIEALAEAGWDFERWGVVRAPMTGQPAS